jgi:hypothetical protein
MKGDIMYPLKLEVKEIQYDISAKCNLITLLTSDGKKIFEFTDYDNYVHLPLLKAIISQLK